jgi:probable phosphoglycerate mutase
MHRSGIDTRAARGALFLARHGATCSNEAGLRIGRSPEPLSPRGVAQARALAAIVARTSVRVVWTSPVVRARQTAGIVARTCGLALETCDDLGEMDFGPLEGLREDEIAARFPEEKRAWSGEPTVAPRGCETIAEVDARVAKALETIGAHEDDALIVTHLVPLRLVHARAAGLPIPCAPSFYPEHATLYRPTPRGLEAAV